MASIPSFVTSDLIEQFLEAKVAAGLSPKTIAVYQQRLALFAEWLEDRPVTRPVLRSYLASLQGRGLAPTTIASYFRDVRVFCSWCAEERLLEPGIARKLMPRVPRHRPASYSAFHIAELLRVCDMRDQAIVIVLLDTGVRVSELISMRRDRIDYSTGRFVVIGKGNKERAAWLSAESLTLVRAYLVDRTDDHPALWFGRSGPLTGSGIHQLLSRRFDQAGIRGDVRRLVHSMRATFAKSYVRGGGDLGSLKDLLGHAGIEMSAHYAQLADDELAEQKRRINPLRVILPGGRG